MDRRLLIPDPDDQDDQDQFYDGMAFTQPKASVDSFFHNYSEQPHNQITENDEVLTKGVPINTEPFFASDEKVTDGQSVAFLGDEQTEQNLNNAPKQGINNRFSGASQEIDRKFDSIISSTDNSFNPHYNDSVPFLPSYRSHQELMRMRNQVIFDQDLRQTMQSGAANIDATTGQDTDPNNSDLQSIQKSKDQI